MTGGFEGKTLPQNRSSRRSFMAMLGLTCVAPGLSGCARWETYRYKLTLAVETPQGVRSAYNVVEVTTTAISVPAQGEYPTVKGEALYLDINGKPLIALLIKKRHSLSPPAAGQRLSSAPGGIPGGPIGNTTVRHTCLIGSIVPTIHIIRISMRLDPLAAQEMRARWRPPNCPISSLSPMSTIPKALRLSIPTISKRLLDQA